MLICHSLGLFPCSRYLEYPLIPFAKGELERPFPQETEYAEKSARLKELNILLNMDEKDKELLDFEPDEGDIEPQKNRDKER